MKDLLLKHSPKNSLYYCGNINPRPTRPYSKAVGSWIREAGKKDKNILIEFLDTWAAKMPGTMLRYAVEKLEKKEREYYLQLQTLNQISK